MPRAGFLAAVALSAFAQDVRILDRSEGMPFFRLSKEPPVEQSDEWFEANWKKADLVMDYAIRQVRLQWGLRHTKSNEAITDGIKDAIEKARSSADLLSRLAQVFVICNDFSYHHSKST
jgi:hypothetical protein